MLITAAITIVLCCCLYLLLKQNIQLQTQLKQYQEETKKVSIDLVKQEHQGQNTEKITQELNKAKEDLKLANNKVIFQEYENDSLVDSANKLIEEVNKLNKELEQERLNNNTVLSQKKGSEVKLGNMAENFVPFLEGFKYDPNSARLLSHPIDFVIFDLYSANPSIILLEVKTGNSQLSPTQKLIKKLVQKGCVRFEEFRVSDKGIKIKVASNEEEPIK
jgi:predicted Holliday junction resolvase-like endonuclease